MKDLSIKDNDIEFTGKDLVFLDNSNQEIVNLIGVWLQTNISSYLLDESLGVDIWQMERLESKTNAVLFFNQQLSFFRDNNLVLNFNLKSFEIIKKINRIEISLEIETSESTTLKKYIVGGV